MTVESDSPTAPRQVWYVAVGVIFGMLFGAAFTWYVATSRGSSDVVDRLWPFPVSPAPIADLTPTTATVYFSAPTEERLIGVDVDVPGNTSREELIRALISHLVGEPPAGVGPSVPHGAELLDVFIDRHDVVYLDLARSWRELNPKGTRSELMTLGALVSTVLENVPRVTGVQILIEGRAAETLAGHVALNRPFTRSPYPTEDDPGYVRIDPVDEF